jgi:hypothetical protein
VNDNIHMPVWQWWNSPVGDATIAEVITAIRGQIKIAADERVHRLVAMRSIYLDIPCEWYEGFGFDWKKRSRYNLTQGAVDSTHAQIVASRPRPKIVTVGADDTAQRRAVLRQRWIDGEYERLGAYEKLSLLALDGLVYGTGALKVGAEDGRPVIDRVWCGDLWVDPREERYGRVRTLYQIHAMDRDVAQLEYPDHEREIRDLQPLEADERTIFADLAIRGYEPRNQIAIIEAWRLPTASKPRRVVVNREPVMLGSGRHVVVCAECVLVDEEWDHPTFPFVFFVWGTDPERFWGQGMVEKGAGMQSDLNELCRVIQESYEVMVPQFWVDDTAGIQKDLNNVVGRVNRCKPIGGDVRTAVQVLSPDVGLGLLSREQEIAQRFLHVLGVDALQAKAEKPAGLNSGAALQNYKDSVSVRFLPQGRRYEQCTVALANLLFFFADKLAADGHPQTVEVFGHDIGLELIEYDMIKPQDGESFSVRVQPASALPKDIAGRIQVLYDLQALGVPLEPERMAELVEMPDIESLTDEINAPRKIVSDAIEQCFRLDEDQPQANAWWPRAIALQMLTRRIQLAFTKRADMRAIERLMNLHTFVRGMPDPNAPLPAPVPNAAAPASPMMGGATGAAPGLMPAAPPPVAAAPPMQPML